MTNRVPIARAPSTQTGNIDEGTLVQKKHPVQTMAKLLEYRTGTGG
jgi:hypothetical protein